jgi:hypothetical protein
LCRPAEADAVGGHILVVDQHPAVAVEDVELGRELAKVGVQAVRSTSHRGLAQHQREARQRAHQSALVGSQIELGETRAGRRRPARAGS